MSLVAEISALRSLPARDLRERYYEVFGEQSRSNNKDYLWKRIAYALQERTYGGVSQRAKQRADELARDEDVRVRGIRLRVRAAPVKSVRAQQPNTVRKRDPRLPPAGAVLKRTFRGGDHEVRVLEDGFEYSKKVYRSLSAVAIEISGGHCNGFGFFGLKRPNGDGQ